MIDDFELMVDLVGALSAQQQLLHDLQALTDDEAGRPSLLPDWTVGHVLTHVARNADSHVRMLDAARRGEVTDQYPGGFEQRAADIEAGATRAAAELVEDVRASAFRLRDAWFAMDEMAWQGTGRVVEGDWPVADLPFRRWREVEVHHADLGLGFSWRGWSKLYVQRELTRVLAHLPERIVDEPVSVDSTGIDDDRRNLAWLLGRADPPAGSPALRPWQATSRTRTP